MKTPDAQAGDPAGRLRGKRDRWQQLGGRFTDWAAPRLPLLVIAFFSLQTVVRVFLSGNLEVDEAQFVGATGFALGFPGSHPPLYNWLVTIALLVTGDAWVPSVAIVKNLLLAGHFILAWDTVRRLRGSPADGLLAAAAVTLLPQIIWQGQVTLAHSVAVGFATFATLHALSLWLLRPSIPRVLWLIVAIVFGILSKYNFLLFLMCLVIAGASLPAIRMRVERGQFLTVAIGAFLLAAPHAAWAVVHFDLTASRVAKLYSERDAISALDIPLVGLDGLVSLFLAALAWGGPLALVWVGIFWHDRRVAPAAAGGGDADWAFSRAIMRLCARTALLGLAVFAIGVFLGDMHKVHERYLTPLLIPAVIALVLRFPPRVSAARSAVCLIAAALFLVSLIAIPAMTAFGPVRLAYPYQAIASDIGDGTEGGATDVLAHRHDLAANIALRLSDGQVWDGVSVRPVIVIWRRGEIVPDWLVAQLGQYYEPVDVPRRHKHDYTNVSGKTVTLFSQLFRSRMRVQ